MDNKAPVLTDANNSKGHKIPIVVIDTTSANYYPKLIEEKDKRFTELSESYDRMFQDCSEMEVKIKELESEVKAGAEIVAKLSDRNMVLEASLADVKNQVEQARKETAQDMFNWLEASEVSTQVDNYRKFTMWVEDYNDIKSKYGIK
jgi:predicted  nucleic acid-binding Zn-ribbon protein